MNLSPEQLAANRVRKDLLILDLVEHFRKFTPIQRLGFRTQCPTNKKIYDIVMELTELTDLTNQELLLD